MADYYPLISRAIAALDKNTEESRATLYDRARAAQVDQLKNNDPPLSEEQIERERFALEAAIERVEDDARVRFAVIPANPEIQALDLGNYPELSPLKRHGIPKPVVLLPSKTVGGAVALGTMLLGFGPAIYKHGMEWSISHALDCLIWPMIGLLLVCVGIFVPLSLVRATRTISGSLFLLSAYASGAMTFVAAVAATYYHLGNIWTIAGLFFLIAGVVPLGIIASILNADWTALSLIGGGLTLTIVNCFAGFWLGDKVDLSLLSKYKRLTSA